MSTNVPGKTSLWSSCALSPWSRPAGSVVHSTNLEVWKKQLISPDPPFVFLSAFSLPSLSFHLGLPQPQIPLFYHVKQLDYNFILRAHLTHAFNLQEISHVVPENGGEKCTWILVTWDNPCSCNRRYTSQPWLQFSQREFPASFTAILALKDTYLSYKIIASKCRPTTDSTQLEGKYSCDGHTERGEGSAQGG